MPVAVVSCLFVSSAFLKDQSSRCSRHVVLEQDCSTLQALNMDTYTNIQLFAVSSTSALPHAAKCPSKTFLLYSADVHLNILKQIFSTPQGKSSASVSMPQLVSLNDQSLKKVLTFNNLVNMTKDRLTASSFWDDNICCVKYFSHPQCHRQLINGENNNK